MYIYQYIPSLVIMLIASIPLRLKYKKIPQNSASLTRYLDRHIDIDSKDQLRTKLSSKRDDFHRPFANFPCPFICSNILAEHVYGVYISQLIRYPRACGSYQDFLVR